VHKICQSLKDFEPEITGNLSESGRVVIDLELNSGESITYHWFVKVKPMDHKNSELMDKFNVFENEITFYKDIAPDLLNFLKVSGVNDVEFNIPKFLFADSSEVGAVIILEDVTSHGYCQEKDPDGGRFLSVQKAKLAIDAIAIIHAASKVYNIHKSSRLEEKHPSLRQNDMWKDEKFLDRLSTMKDCYCEILKKIFSARQCSSARTISTNL